MPIDAVRELIDRYALHDGALPVPIRQVARDEGWHVLWGDISMAYGYAVVVGAVRIMVINEAITPAYQRFAIAHEMAHVINGDAGSVHLCSTDRSQFDLWINSREERAASLTAARILIPTDVLIVDTPIEDIACRCGVPVALARLWVTEMLR